MEIEGEDRTDPAEQLINELHLTLENMGAPVVHTYGAVKKLSHADWPLMNWIPGSLSYVDEPIAVPVDTLTAPIATEVQEYFLRIWGRDYLDCRTMLRNLRRASRIAALGQRFAIQSFDWLTEQQPGHTNRGALLAGTVTLKMPVEEQAVPLARMAKGKFTVTVEFPNGLTEVVYTTGEFTSG